MKKRIVLLLLSCALACPCTAQDGGAGREVLIDQWQVVRLAGTEAGYVHTVMTRLGQGADALFETRVDQRMVIRRLGSEIKIVQSSTSVETPAGALVRSQHTSELSNQKTRVEVEFAGNEARLVTHLMGRERKKTIELPPDTVGPYGIHRIGLEKGLKPGTTWEASTFVTEMSSVTDVYTEVIGPEQVEMPDGRMLTLTKVVTEADVVPAPVTTWVDEHGIARKTSMRMAGLEIETVDTTEARARAASGGGTLPPDVFERSLVVATNFLPFPRSAETAVLELRARRAGSSITLPSSPRQEVGEPDASGAVRVRLRRHVPPEGHGSRRPLEDVPAELCDALAANTMIQSDEPEIREIAASAVGDERDAWKAAQLLERWVQANVTDKNFDVGYASALEVCRDRSGDCSEHAVLLAALCRAAGIPARVAMGVVYLGGIWGGHAWNEVWIDGAWYPLDGTLGYGFVDPLHLTMISADLADGQMGAEFAGIFGNLGNLDIRVVGLTHEARTVEPQAPGAVDVVGDRYANRLWSLSCEKPAEFEFDVRKPKAAMRFVLVEFDGRTESGQRCEIEVRAHDVAPPGDWEGILQRFGKGPRADRELEVDGRSAREIELADGGRRVLVRVSSGVFLFEIDRLDGAADEKRFAAFLKSVDFDLTAH